MPLSWKDWRTTEMLFLPQSADRCRNLWPSPDVSPRRWNQTADLRKLRAGWQTLECTPESPQSAGRRTRHRPANKIQRRAAQPVRTSVLCWEDWRDNSFVEWLGEREREGGASSSSLLRSGGRRLSSNIPASGLHCHSRVCWERFTQPG